MASNGIPKDSCDPYISGGGNSYTGQCNHQCSNEQFYKAKNVTGFNSINDAKMNIMQNGPVQTGFTVYQDFITEAESTLINGALRSVATPSRSSDGEARAELTTGL